LADAYEKHAKDLVRFCQSKTRNKQEAEDLMQETFLRTWKYLQAGKIVEDLRAFLYRVAENLTVDSSRRKREMSLDALQEQGFDPGHEPVERTRVTLDVESLINSVDRTQETRLLFMRYVEGLRPVDIAQRMGLPANTVVVRLHRAMQRLTKKVMRQQLQSETRRAAKRADSNP
jgi:RNA polymerase sigma-70 factor, ECF subfamily